jgi:hypothetical protein
MKKRYTPYNCPHCAYDRKFPGFEEGGWINQDNNGPIVACPVCNDDGKYLPLKDDDDEALGCTDMFAWIHEDRI